MRNENEQVKQVNKIVKDEKEMGDFYTGNEDCKTGVTNKQTKKINKKNFKRL